MNYYAENPKITLRVSIGDPYLADCVVVIVSSVTWSGLIEESVFINQYPEK